MTQNGLGWTLCLELRTKQGFLPAHLIPSYYKTCKNKCSNNNSDLKQSLIFLMMPISTFCRAHLPLSNRLHSHYLLMRFPSFITLWGQCWQQIKLSSIQCHRQLQAREIEKCSNLSGWSLRRSKMCLSNDPHFRNPQNFPFLYFSSKLVWPSTLKGVQTWWGQLLWQPNAKSWL